MIRHHGGIVSIVIMRTVRRMNFEVQRGIIGNRIHRFR